MNLKSNDIWLGTGVVTFGVFLLVYAIPVFVSSPSNVRVLFLSPTFWPIIIAWIVIFLGAVLVVSSMFAAPDARPETVEAGGMSHEETLYATARLVAAAIIMASLVWAIPILGMVPATGIAFALISAIVMAPRPGTALIVTIVLPLVLYAFFAHVAGVSVPQGRFLTLP